MSSHATTMHAHSPASYSLAMILALMIHGAIAAVLVLSAYFFNDIKKKSSDIFEVVAGPGDNWRAPVAPAQGVPDAPDNVTYTPTPDTPHPAPIPEAQPEPEPTPVARATSVPHDAVVIPPPKAKPQSKKTDITKQSVPGSKITKADFDKQNAKHNQNLPSSRPPSKTPSSTTANNGKAVTPKPIISPGKGLVDGVPGGSGSEQGAGGRALTTVERDQLTAYLATLAERIKQAHVKPEGVSMELVTRVEYYVGADGHIGAVKIIKSSGNRAFDDSVLKAFRSVSGPGERPDGRGSAITADFRMKEE